MSEAFDEVYRKYEEQVKESCLDKFIYEHLNKQIQEQQQAIDSLQAWKDETLYHIPHIDKTKESAQKTILEMQQTIDAYENGQKGACSTCEPVGELNVELQQAFDSLVECVNIAADSFGQVNMLTSQRRMDQCLNDPMIKKHIKDKK